MLPWPQESKNCTVNRRALIQMGRLIGELPPLSAQPKPRQRRRKKQRILRPIFWAHAPRNLGIADIAIAPEVVQAAYLDDWPAERLFPVRAIPYGRPWQIWPRRAGPPPLVAMAWAAKYFRAARGGAIAFQPGELRANVTPLRSAGDPDIKRRASLRRLLGWPPLAGDEVTTLPTPSSKEVNARLKAAGNFTWPDDPYALDYEEAERAAQTFVEATWAPEIEDVDRLAVTG
jgi:hypothetical protein